MTHRPLFEQQLWRMHKNRNPKTRKPENPDTQMSIHEEIIFFLQYIIEIFE
jgi:hypothetical protein